MKKIIVLGLILLGFSSSSLLVSADVISPGYRPVGRCEKIINLNQFPSISLIGRISGPGTSNNTSGDLIEIKNNECISRGYKFNSFNIYWNIKGKISVIDDNKLIIDERMGSSFDNIKDNDPIIKKEVEYSIAKSSDGKYSLKKNREISFYNSGKPNKIETFSIPDKEQIIKEIKKETDPVVEKNVEKEKYVPFEGDDIDKLEQEIVKKGFWQKVKCFFRISKNC